MSEKNNRFDPLLKEINDPYVQENFYRLKQYLDTLIASGLLGVPGNITQNINVSAGAVEGVVRLTKIMDCVTSVSDGDWIYQSTSTNNFAVAASDNSPPFPVIGVVIDKPTTTTCEVMLLGIAEIVVGRGYVYLGTSGETTNTAPGTGFVQRLGISFGDGQVLVRPDVTRIKKV